MSDVVCVESFLPVTAYCLPMQHNCGALVRNKAGDTPFDLAVRFNRRGKILRLYKKAIYITSNLLYYMCMCMRTKAGMGTKL